MQERTMSATPRQSGHAEQRDAEQRDAEDTPRQTTVPMSLLDAVMDVDAAIDDGGLELQEALARMHEELAHVIPGPGSSPMTRGTSVAPVSREQSSSRT